MSERPTYRGFAHRAFEARTRGVRTEPACVGIALVAEPHRLTVDGWVLRRELRGRRAVCRFAPVARYASSSCCAEPSTKSLSAAHRLIVARPPVARFGTER